MSWSSRTFWNKNGWNSKNKTQKLMEVNLVDVNVLEVSRQLKVCQVFTHGGADLKRLKRLKLSALLITRRQPFGSFSYRSSLSSHSCHTRSFSRSIFFFSLYSQHFSPAGPRVGFSEFRLFLLIKQERWAAMWPNVPPAVLLNPVVALVLAGLAGVYPGPGGPILTLLLPHWGIRLTGSAFF